MDIISNNRAYGPPSRLPPRVYAPELEQLETVGNNKLIRVYKNDIKMFMSELEGCNDINPSMIDLQPEIQWFMRPFLLDYIVELHSSFRLQSQTLFRCFNIVDRYCAKRIVFKRHYQLVGCTALWIAAKYEDKKSRVPTLKELAMMCRNAYDEEMFVQMERHVLSTLEWSLERPTLEDCLQLSIELCLDVQNCTPLRSRKSATSASTISALTAVSRFLCELSLYHRDFLNYETSLVASVSCILACSILKLPQGSEYLYHVKRLMSNWRQELEDDIENIENIAPEIFGLFLSGLDEYSILKIRKIGYMMCGALSQVSEVLTTKYKPLGVILVIENFLQQNPLIFEKIETHKANNISIDENEFAKSELGMVADYLLGISEYDSRETRDTSLRRNAPITPPSTSRSIFSDSAHNSSPSYTPTSCKIGNDYDYHKDFPPTSASQYSENSMHHTRVENYESINKSHYENSQHKHYPYKFKISPDESSTILGSIN